MMFIECPKPRAKTIQLKVRPVAWFTVCSIQTIACVQDLSFGQFFAGTRLDKTCTHQVFTFVNSLSHPFVEAMSAFMLTRQIHSIGDERTIAEPAIMIRREIRTSDITTARRLIFKNNLDTALI